MNFFKRLLTQSDPPASYFLSADPDVAARKATQQTEDGHSIEREKEAMRRIADAKSRTADRSFATRSEAQEAHRRAVAELKEIRTARLKTEIQRINALADEDLKEAERADHATKCKLIGELVAEANKRFAPVVAAYRAEPGRQLALALRAEIQTLLARETEETPPGNGLPKVFSALGFTFADQLLAEHPNAVNVLGGVDWGARYVSAIFGVAKSLGDVSAFASALENLEAALSEIASRDQRPLMDRLVRRYQLRRLQDPEALACFDAAETASELTEFRVSYVQPRNAVDR